MIPSSDPPSRPLAERLPLKQNLNRSVFLEQGPEGAEVIKRYHGDGRLHRLFDFWRAHGERRRLAWARTVGLPVPRAVAVRRNAGHWELVTEHLPGAVSLRAVFDGEADWPVAPERLARSLARLHARLVAAGFAHRDLHAGNVLVDAQGRTWLIDLARARLGARASAGKVRGELLRLAADAREAVGPTFRARYLVAFLAGLADDLLAALPAPAVLAAELEEASLERRRLDLERARLRWTRTSSVTRALRRRTEEGQELVAIVRRGVAAEEVEQWLAALPPAGRRVRALGEPARFAHQRGLVVGWFDAPRRALRDAWSASARLAMHGVPAARPLALVARPRAAALFELPGGDLPLEEWQASRELRRRAAHSLGKLFGTLHARGLAVRDLAPRHVWLESEARAARLGPGLPLVPLDQERRRESLGALASWSRDEWERALFARAYLRHAAHGRKREALRSELERLAGELLTPSSAP